MKKAPQNYSFAYNSNNGFVNIDDTQQGEKYFCPICGDEMTPHKGKVRRWHFVHKNKGNCSYESYLHKLAKSKIRQAFLDSDHFMLSYKAKAVCSHECPFIPALKCEDEKQVEFDLRKYYDSCEEEVPYKEFRADLLLSSSKYPERQPILIEIMVTHKCTEEKIEEGVRIIEIPIQSEEDIDKIIKECKIMGVRNERRFCVYIDKTLIKLYNFNKEERYDPSKDIKKDGYCFNRKETFVFKLENNGRFSSFGCYCVELFKILPLNVHYYVSTINTSYKKILQGFSKRGVKIRNCFLCKYSRFDRFDNRICVLYKKYDLPRKPSPYLAEACPFYREDFETARDDLAHEDLSRERCLYHICEEIL